MPHCLSRQTKAITPSATHSLVSGGGPATFRRLSRVGKVSVMADKAVVHMGENSPEEVAYKMMLLIANAEGRELYSHGKKPVTRAWVLSTYAQCRRAVIDGWAAKSILEEVPVIE